MSKYVFPLDAQMAEYVFAPFFDHEHSRELAVEIDGQSTATVTRETEWCYTKFVWNGSRPSETAVLARCLSPFEVFGHDSLALAFTLPVHATIEFALLDAERNIVGSWSEPIGGTGVRQEAFLRLDRLLWKQWSWQRLLPMFHRGRMSFGGVAFRVVASSPALGVLALTWFGLRNSELCRAADASRAQHVPDWTPWLLPRSQWGEFAPELDLLFGGAEIERVREKKDRPGWREHFSLLEDKARKCLERRPEDDFGEYLPNHDLRFTRFRPDPARAYHWDALVVAFVGLVNRDERMVGHALRSLMCMLHTQHWADSAEQRIPSSTWNQRSFMEEMTTTSVAILSDWLGFALTPQAKSLVRQALWTRGMSHVQRDLFQYDYMHSMNQGAVFCRALILGGLLLEKAWPRAARVADDAYEAMKTVLKRYIKPDGGISEGPGYLCQTLTATLWAVIAYCRARNRDWRAEVEELFGAVESYVRVMAAGRPGKCIPSGDCRLEWFSGDGIPILASVYPESAYADMLLECLKEGWIHELTGTLKGSGGMIGMVYGPDNVKPSRYVAAPSTWLQDTGKFSRTKDALGRRVRLWATASIYGASHSHLDHGAFVLEIDDSPVFVDLGMVEYWKADAIHQMKRSFAHNVLTPVEADGTYADQRPLMAPSQSPSAVTDSLVLRVPGHEVWTEKMSDYVRTFEDGDDRSNTYLIRDAGKLNALGRVAFHLHTPHLFSAGSKSVAAELAGIRCTVRFPWAKEIRVAKSLPDFAGREIFHICAVSDELSHFNLETAISVASLGDPHRIG
jgi:hypothetical protein